jgi:predicted ATP-grasp superfamily ATP-dependent carboligase
VKALIVGDAHLRGSLAAVRALARAGWEVSIGSPARGISSSSRFCSRWHHVPAPERSLDAFGAAVASAVSRHRYDVVFGGGDAEVLAVSAIRETLPARVPYTPHARLLRAIDKLELARIARRAGVSTPATVPAREDWDAHLPLPVVVKPSLHWQPGCSGPSRLEATVCRNTAEVARRTEEIERWGRQALVQEFVEGELLAYVALTDAGGAVVAAFAQATDRIWPLRTGVFARASTCAVDHGLAAKTSALLRELGWFGVAQLQFQVGHGREPLLIDFNGRFYLSLALATGAGLNLPALWAAMAVGVPAPAAAAVPEGVRYQWLEGDLRRAVSERRGGLVTDVVATLRYARGATHTLWDPEDLRPAASYFSNLPLRAALKVRGRPRAGTPRRAGRDPAGSGSRVSGVGAGDLR